MQTLDLRTAGNITHMVVTEVTLIVPLYAFARSDRDRSNSSQEIEKLLKSYGEKE
jgi:hypothetical protein